MAKNKRLNMLAIFGFAVLELMIGDVKAAEPAKPLNEGQTAPQKKSKFNTPVWHSDTRWEFVKLGGVDSGAHLDGPSQEMEMYSLGALGPGYRNAQGGQCYIGWWDPDSGRAHEVAGSGRGLLDGPFSRARFTGWHYIWDPDPVFDADRRNLFIADAFKGAVHIRCLDFEKQEVRTVLPDLKGFLSMAAAPGGKLLVVTQTGLFKLNAADGAKEGEVKLEEVDKVRRYPRGFAPAVFDEVHGRLYIGLQHPDWYLWYWDVKDGSFHGVLPKTAEGKSRGRNQPGPFEGTAWYGESGTISFGPDDPEKRFLYSTNNDTWQFFRLDLEKRQVAAIVLEGNGKDGKPMLARFSETEAAGHVPVYLYHKWHDDGSVTFYTHSPITAPLFKRVK